MDRSGPLAHEDFSRVAARSTSPTGAAFAATRPDAAAHGQACTRPPVPATRRTSGVDASSAGGDGVRSARWATCSNRPPVSGRRSEQLGVRGAGLGVLFCSESDRLRAGRHHEIATSAALIASVDGDQSAPPRRLRPDFDWCVECSVGNALQAVGQRPTVVPVRQSEWTWFPRLGVEEQMAERTQ